MKWLWKRAIALLSVYYAHMLEYRAELFFWMLSGSFPIILMGVWMEASQGGQFGLSAVDFARYFIAVFLVRQFTIVWVVWEFEKEVVQGKLSLRLLQPIDPVWHYIAAHISERFARFPFVIVLVSLFFMLYPQALWLPNPQQLLLGAIATFMAVALRFLLQYTSAMLAFWTERASAIEQFLFLFYLFFAGYIAPLDVFPSLVRAIAQWTPFPYLLYFPAAIFVGFPIDIGRGFIVMLSWGFLLLTINRWLWRRGLKHYSGMGA